MKTFLIFIVVASLTGCSSLGSEGSGASSDGRAISDTREDVCSGAAAIIRANTALMGKMRENVVRGFFDWDAGRFWSDGNEIAELAAPLRDSAHPDDTDFNSAANSLEFAYRQFSSESFRDAAGSEWTANRNHLVQVSQSLLGPLERFADYC